MAKVIRSGRPYRYYDFECPKCHSIVRFGESELHEYEDCYDTPMVETDKVCPNCLGRHIQVPKARLNDYLVKPKKEIKLEETKEEIKKEKISFWKKLFKI